jgi:hypothetical protein
MKAKKVYEAIGDILHPKSEEEINQAIVDRYGFAPSEETLVLTQDRAGKRKFMELRGYGERLFPIEYHLNVHEDGNWNSIVFYELNPEKKYSTLTALEGSKLNWLINVIKGEIPFADTWEKGPAFEEAKDLIEYFESL